MKPQRIHPDDLPVTPGRPTKYNEATVRELEAAIEIGCNFTEAAALAGVHHNTLKKWRDTHPELEPLLARAEARGIHRWVKTINDAAERDPRMAQWLLEHRHPDRWARANRGQVEVNVGSNSTVQLVDKAACEQMADSWKAFVDAHGPDEDFGESS